MKEYGKVFLVLFLICTPLAFIFVEAEFGWWFSTGAIIGFLGLPALFIHN